MKKFQYHFFFLIILQFSNLSAQVITINDTYTPTQLINSFFSNSGGCGVANNVTISGGSFSGAQSFGYFTNGGSSFPLTDGIILSTGRAISAIGPNTGNSSETLNGWNGDNDLNAALSLSNTFDATILEFDFTPFTNKISFDYIFSSEQYLSNPSPNQCGFTDGFAFLIKPTGGTYQNIALVPNSTTPVSVNTIRGSGTICPAANAFYFDAFNGSIHPTTFNGQTKILKAKADVVAGNSYHIKLVIADQGNGLFDSAIFLGGGTFQSETDLGPDRLYATNNPYCSGENVVLNGFQPGTNTYRWYKDGVFTGITSPTYTITDNTNTNVVAYSVEVLINGSCLSTGKVNIQFAPNPVLLNQTLYQCDEDGNGSATFNLTKLDNLIKGGDTSLGAVTYFESIGGTQISNPTNYNSIPKIIFAKVSNQYQCSSYAQVNLAIANNNVSSPFTFDKCDIDATKDGKTLFDLNTEVSPLILTGLPSGLSVEYYPSVINAENQTSALPNSFTNSVANSETIYARIVNGPDCYDIIEVVLNVNYIDPINFLDETLYICPNEVKTLEVDAIYDNYNWSNGGSNYFTDITNSGIYTVEVTDANGCKATKKFTVISSAPATNIDATIVSFSNNNSITITYTDNGGNYEFSLDGINYQSSPNFENLSPGKYTIYVRDKNGCDPTPSKEVYVLDYPKYFTPNNDGFNDFWKIENIDKQGISTISIFNRFGKLLKQLSSNSSGWDGTYLGKPLPSDDYWFILTLFNNQTIKSHFTLKR